MLSASAFVRLLSALVLTTNFLKLSKLTGGPYWLFGVACSKCAKQSHLVPRSWLRMAQNATGSKEEEFAFNSLMWAVECRGRCGPGVACSVLLYVISSSWRRTKAHHFARNPPARSANAQVVEWQRDFRPSGRIRWRDALSFDNFVYEMTPVADPQFGSEYPKVLR